MGMDTATRHRLQPFCARESLRYATDSMWNCDGQTYATDSRIMVREPTSEPDTMPGDKERPRAWAFFDSMWKDRKFRKWPYPPAASCDQCPGTGRIEATTTCEECDGTGRAECWHCKQDMACEECEGVGTVIDEQPCKCSEPYTTLVVNKRASIDAKYVRLISGLSGVTWLPIRNAILFRFDGGQGICMAIARE